MSEQKDLDLLIGASTPGIPLRVAEFLIHAIGTAYPATVLLSNKDWESGLKLRIAAADYLSEPDPDATWPDPEKTDPETEAFTNGIRDGAIGISPPPWLGALLQQASRGVLSFDPDANYVHMEVLNQKEPDAGRIAWIVCRPGKPSPHDLRRKAEARVAELEALLTEHGIRLPDESAA